VVEPAKFDNEAMLEVHVKDYLDFLKTACAKFRQSGFEGSPTPCVWPRGGMRDYSSDSILAKLGRFCFDGVIFHSSTDVPS
jgi:acetoin utilization deacetylase AcuC-like enzyme